MVTCKHVRARMRTCDVPVAPGAIGTPVTGTGAFVGANDQLQHEAALLLPDQQLLPAFLPVPTPVVQHDAHVKPKSSSKHNAFLAQVAGAVVNMHGVNALHACRQAGSSSRQAGRQLRQAGS